MFPEFSQYPLSAFPHHGVYFSESIFLHRNLWLCSLHIVGGCGE
jgi:hypothetical protein